ncbi:PAS domain S-box protein [Gilvimarinus sp. F26214L]|uniref:PAS domain S-box protein n=1 Tax=Gilvimarinus sp. DZF01 TaxID=3461371 RepID=UPI0040462F06
MAISAVLLSALVQTLWDWQFSPSILLASVVASLLLGTGPAVLTAVLSYALSGLVLVGRPFSLDTGNLSVIDASTYFLSSGAILVIGTLARRTIADAQIRTREEETRARLAAIVSASDDAIVSKSLDGIIRSWNAGAERLLGYSAEEIIGRSINTIIPSELWSEERDIIHRIRSGERLEHFETVRLRKDQQRIHLSITVSPILDDRGRVIGASKVARDITEKKRAEAALRASEQRFRRLADAAPVSIWMTDPDAKPYWFNKRWLDFTGRSLEEEINDGWQSKLHPDDRNTIVETYERRVAAREPFSAEYRLRRADGQYRWILSNGLPLYEDNERFVGYAGSSIDLTERKEAEDALRTADRRKNEFIATLAHELRNPLAPIRNSLEILKQAKQDPALLNKSRDTIERQLNHMVRLVDDLLNISRISRDKLTLRTSEVELRDVVQQAIEICEPLAKEMGHTVDVQTPDEPVFLDADPDRLSQVLSNLLSNACKFTDPGGHITVDAKREGDQVRVAVKDNGIGIAQNQLDSIFDLFGQADTSLTRTVSGLGIGLTLAKRLAELHGGSISVHSEGLGKGSEFVVVLPTVAARNLPSSEPGALTNVSQTSRRILIVEDNTDSAETLAILLRLNGHEVEVIHNGLEAVEVAERFTPELLLLDIGLPGLDGYEVCRRIRQRPWAEAAVIVALTGWSQDEDRQQSAAAGFDYHIVKPVSYSALSDILAQVSANGDSVECPQRSLARH